MDAEMLIGRLKEKLAAGIIDVENPSAGRVFVRIKPENLLDAVRTLREDFGFTYLATITGLDRGDSFELLYHFADACLCLTVRFSIPRDAARIPTITGIIPGAVLYERELQDVFGIQVENIPDNRSLLLPDDWPPGNYPLRKDWTYEAPPEKIPGDEK